MTTERVEQSLNDKSPIKRGSESYERTFEIEAVEQEGGVKAKITDIQVKEQYNQMHYDLQWSTRDNRNVPFVGGRVTDKEDAIYENSGDSLPFIPQTPNPNHSIAVVFETINEEKYHMRWSIGMIDTEKEELLITLLQSVNATNLSNNPIDAVYEPTSDTGGFLKIQSQTGQLSRKRRAHKGTPDDSYRRDTNMLDTVSAWIEYKKQIKNGTEWVGCRVVNAYESDDGEEVSLVTETPVGQKTVFNFDVKNDKSTPYWTLLDDIAQGDPANLTDSNNTVYLRHRSRSFYNLGVSEHRELIRGKDANVLGTDVNWEWELRTTKPNAVESVKNTTTGIFDKILSYFS